MVWGMWVREVILAVPTCIGRKKRGREGRRLRLALSRADAPPVGAWKREERRRGRLWAGDNAATGNSQME